MMVKRSVRRTLVVVYFLALLVLYPPLADRMGTLPLFLFLSFSPASAKGTELLKAYNERFDFDERQNSLVKNAVAVAYTIFAGLLLATSLANIFLPYASAGLQNLNDKLIFSQLFTFRALLILFVTLPPAVMMWLEPNPPIDESKAAVLADTHT